MKIFKRLLDVLIVIMNIILLLVLYGNIEKNVFKKSYINYFGFTFFEVASGSMEPTIKTGDVVLVKITNDFKENDIITYKEENYFVTHRIIRIEKNKIIAKGDNNNSGDKEINKDDCLGKVIKIIPNVGTWRNVFLNTKVVVTVIVTILLFSIYFSLLEKKKVKKNEEVTKEDKEIKT